MIILRQKEFGDIKKRNRVAKKIWETAQGKKLNLSPNPSGYFNMKQLNEIPYLSGNDVIRGKFRFEKNNWDHIMKENPVFEDIRNINQSINYKAGGTSDKQAKIRLINLKNYASDYIKSLKK